jgi:hypothetical protein
MLVKCLILFCLAIFATSRPTLVLGLVWQIIKAQLTSGISLHSRPELIHLLNSNGIEDIASFMKLSTEHILLRWVNYHVTRSGLTPRTAGNFASDIAVR